MPSLDAFVWVHIRPATEGHILDECQGIQGQETQIIGNGFIAVTATRLLLSWWWRHRVPRDGPLVTTPCGPNDFHTHLLQSHARIIESRFEGHFHGLFGQQSNGSVRVD